MDSDIKLNDGRVVLEGDFCEVHAHDLMLDSPERRVPPNSTGGFRRALVHYDDALVLNWAGDYPGGVSVASDLSVERNLHVGGPDLLLDDKARRARGSNPDRETTVGAAFVDLGPLNNVVALAIAASKAALVGLFFMHLRWSSRLLPLAAVAGLFWLSLLIAGSLGDYFTRGMLGVPGK